MIPPWKTIRMPGPRPSKRLPFRSRRQQRLQAAPVAQEAAAPAAWQHPGWLWDQTTNQWVPDPNYQQPPQQ